MENIKITNLVKFYTLLLLSHSPKHGYEIKKELEGRLKRKVSASHVYPFLKMLRKANYIKFEKTSNRDKKIYHLTKEGKIFVKSILNRFGDFIDIAIEPKLTVCAHCGCTLYKGGHKESIKGKTLMFCCYHCAKSFKLNA